MSRWVGPIRIGADEWIVMREIRQYPKAVVQRVTDTAGEERYLLMTWRPNPADRRMVGIYTSLQEAYHAVPWPDPHDVAPLDPRATKQQIEEQERRRAEKRASDPFRQPDEP